MNQSNLKIKSNPRDVVEILRVRQKETHRIIKKLESSGVPEAIYLSEVLRQTVADENLYVGYGMTNYKGEKFDGFDALTMIASRLSMLYIRQQSRRARRRAIAYLSRVKPELGERWLMLTLTMPRLRGLDFVQTKEVFNDALRRFRQSVLFKKNVRGGIKSEEFTLGEDFENGQDWTISDGYHIHAHLILCSKWLSWLEVGETWKKCLLSACERFSIEIEFKTAHNRPVVHLRHVTDKGENKDTLTFSDAITEACKYVTKGSNFEKLPITELLKIEDALRGRRLIEALGEANQRKGSESFTLSTDLVTPEHQKSQKESAKVDDAHYLDNPNTIESLNLRTQCLNLIKIGKFDEFKEHLEREFTKRRNFRRRHLAMTFPDAEFFTLDGEVFTFKTFEIEPKPYRHLKLV